MEFYAEVRRCVYVEGLSERAAARRFGLARETVRKMLRYRLPPGYRRTQPIRCPKLDGFTGIIDQILRDDQHRPKKQRHTAKRICERLRAEHAFRGVGARMLLLRHALPIFWRSDARTNTIFGMKSRVHPKYKTKYHVCNWPEYERALVRRGDITLWLSADAIAAWTPAPSGRRGGQRKFSDNAIETALALRLVFGLPLRQAEGFLRSVLSLMNVDLEAPDHTTLSRRSQHLNEVPPGSAQRTAPSHRRQHRALARRPRRVGCREARRTGHTWLEETPLRCRRIGRDRRAYPDRRECRRRNDRAHADRCG